MEEDILGVSGVNLLYVSCKRGGHRGGLSRILEETYASGQRIGGRFAEKILAIYLPLKPKLKAQLFSRAKELRIKIISAEEVKER